MTSEAGAQDAPMDFGRIQDTSEGDTEFEQELFDAYLEDCESRFGNIRSALAAGDAEQFRREAHTVKGASANVGTTRLHTLARELELTDIADRGAAESLIERAEAEYERVKSAIANYLETL